MLRGVSPFRGDALLERKKEKLVAVAATRRPLYLIREEELGMDYCYRMNPLFLSRHVGSYTT